MIENMSSSASTLLQSFDVGEESAAVAQLLKVERAYSTSEQAPELRASSPGYPMKLYKIKVAADSNPL